MKNIETVIGEIGLDDKGIVVIEVPGSGFQIHGPILDSSDPAHAEQIAENNKNLDKLFFELSSRDESLYVRKGVVGLTKQLYTQTIIAVSKMPV